MINYSGFLGVHLVVEVNAFQWNVRPRWGRNFWKSVRCCVQLVFSMFVFSPIDGLSWVFHGYHADGCGYSLVFWEFCTSLVARSAVQDSYKHRRILGRCYNKCLWGMARMGSVYHFNLLMYFFALRIGTRRLPVISFWVYPLYSQRWKSWQLYTCLPSLRPFVSPLSPQCLPYSPFVSSSISLLLPAAAAWLGFLFCSTAESSWVCCWSAAWSAAAAAVVVACVAASGQGAVFGQRSKRFVKGLEAFACLRISPLWPSVYQ